MQTPVRLPTGQVLLLSQNLIYALDMITCSRSRSRGALLDSVAPSPFHKSASTQPLKQQIKFKTFLGIQPLSDSPAVVNLHLVSAKICCCFVLIPSLLTYGLMCNIYIANMYCDGSRFSSRRFICVRFAAAHPPPLSD